MDLSEPAPLSAEELAELPVFPLPRVVFFPGSVLPLHLFEPRYRAMVERCIDTGPDAMAVTLLQPGYEPHYDARPPIHSVAGAGRIVAHHRHPDGTHDIVLHGLARVRLDELPPQEGTPFRLARATPLVDPPAHLRSADIAALYSCATSIAAVVREQHSEFELGVAPSERPSHLIDAIADRFVADPGRRQSILEALDLQERLDLTTDAVGELLALLATHSAPS